VKRVLALTLMLALPAHHAAAQSESGTDIPFPLQAMLFKKILTYDKRFGVEGLAAANIVVIARPALAKEAEALANAFAEVGLKARHVTPDALARDFGDAAILYFLDDVDHERLGNLAISNKAVTIEGGRTFVERGRVSIGLGKKADGRPEILIHRSRLEQEGHELSSKVLSLATIVG